MEYFVHRTYAENMKAAEYFLSIAKEAEYGRRWNLLAAVAFSAFAVEAFVNHIGVKTNKNWNKWDKIKRPCTDVKLKNIGVKFESDLNRMFTELFTLRSMIVHGRTHNISKKTRKPQNNLNGAIRNLSSDLERRTSTKKVEYLVFGAKNIISSINRQTINVPRQKLWSIGSGSVRTASPA